MFSQKNKKSVFFHWNSALFGAMLILGYFLSNSLPSIFLFLCKNILCRYTLEVLLKGTHNICFHGEIKQYHYFFVENGALAAGAPQMIHHTRKNVLIPYILSTAVTYLCVIAVQHFLNEPHGKINTSNLSIPVPFNMVVCRVIIVWTQAL